MQRVIRHGCFVRDARERVNARTREQRASLRATATRTTQHNKNFQIRQHFLLPEWRRKESPLPWVLGLTSYGRRPGVYAPRHRATPAVSPRQGQSMRLPSALRQTTCSVAFFPKSPLPGFPCQVSCVKLVRPHFSPRSTLACISPSHLW